MIIIENRGFIAASFAANDVLAVQVALVQTDSIFTDTETGLVWQVDADTPPYASVVLTDEVALSVYVVVKERIQAMDRLSTMNVLPVRGGK